MLTVRCVSAAVRERDSPTGNVSGNVCHGIGNPGSAWTRGHGQAHPGLDNQGQIYCSLAELWVA